MRILMDSHMLGQNSGGIERYWINLIRCMPPHLQKDRIELCLYCNLPAVQLSEPLQEHLHYHPASSNGLFRIIFGFDRAISKFKPDLIHVNNFTPLIKKLPTVVTVHDLCFQDFPETFSKKSIFAFRYFFSRSLKQADAVICVSDSVRENLISSYRINPGKVFSILHGIDPKIKWVQEKIEVKKQLDQKFKINQNFFLVIGHIEPRKNVVPVIHAFEELSKENGNLQLVITGKDKMGVSEQPAIRELISTGRLKILGYVQDADLALLYNGALAFIFNSMCEGFGIPLIEAMACRTPIIANDIDIFREVCEDVAILVKGIKEIYQAMKRIISDENFSNKLALLGFERSKLFSWEKTAQQTLEVYQTVLKKTKLLN